MASVVGADISSYAVDLVKLSEDSNNAEWIRVPLEGDTAFERTLTLPDQFLLHRPVGWLDDVFLFCSETPTPDQRRELRLVQGVLIGCLPAHLRRWHACWTVYQQTWKSALGLKGKPTWEDLLDVAGPVLTVRGEQEWDQNARDALCIAVWARDENARRVAAA